MPRTTDIGPSAPWFEEDGPEYVGDDVLYSHTIDQVTNQLAEHLEARLERLRAAPSPRDLMNEIRDQMTVAAAQGNFGEARELHDLALALLMAEDGAKRAV